MPISVIPTKARKDPLGYQLLSTLADNLALLQDGPGHGNTGLHNNNQVPRAVGSFVWGGASYTLDSGSSGFIASITHNGTGDVTVNFTADKVTTVTGYCRPRIAIIGTAAKPSMWTCETPTADSVRIHLFQMTDALGAGNTWAATDLDFAISMNAQPYAGGEWARSLIQPHRGNTLGADVETVGLERGNWNQYVQDIGTTRANLLVGHTSTGAHNCREVARAYGRVAWGDTASTYTYLDYTTGRIAGTLTRVAKGKITVDLSASAFTTPYQVFPIVDRNRHSVPGDPTYTHSSPGALMFTVDSSAHAAGSFLVSIFGFDFDALTWDYADADFSFVVHGPPV